MRVRLSHAILMSLLLSACGSGGGGGGANSNPPPPPPNSGGVTLSTPPTATLPASQDDAAALAAEIQADAVELATAAATTSLSAGVTTLAAGLVTTIQCSQLGSGGSGSYTIDSNITGPITAGSTFTTTYDNCTYTTNGNTIEFDGVTSSTYTRYTSPTDYAITITYSDFSYSLTNATVSYAYGPLNSSYSYDVANGTFAYHYVLSRGGATSISSANVVRSGTNVTISSGTRVYNSPSGNGIVRTTFSAWTFSTASNRPVSGSIAVTGANGAEIIVTASATHYTLDYRNSSGSVGTYTVSYPE